MTTYSLKELSRRQKAAPEFFMEKVLPEIIKAAPNSLNRKRIFTFLNRKKEAMESISPAEANRLVWALHAYDAARIRKMISDYWYT
jgi:hypothetical protein